MKIVIVVLALAGTAWYWFIGGRQLDDEAVRAYYDRQTHAVLSRDPVAQCELLSPQLVAHVQSRVGGQLQDATLDKAQACKGLVDQARFFEEAGNKAGGILTIEYHNDIQRITIAPNRKSAEVEVVSTLKMGEAFMEITSTSTDRLERRLGKVMTVGADAQTRMRWTPGALADPEKYFRSQ